MASRPITSWKIEGEKLEEVTDFIFWAPNLLGTGTAVMKLKDACSLEWKLTQFIKSKKHHFSDNGPYGQNYGFSSSHVWVWDVGHKRRLSTKVLMLSNCVAGENSWESLIRVPYKEIKKKKKILKAINPEYSLKRLMLNLKLQYFVPLIWKTNSY